MELKTYGKKSTVFIVIQKVKNALKKDTPDKYVVCATKITKDDWHH